MHIPLLTSMIHGWQKVTGAGIHSQQIKAWEILSNCSPSDYLLSTPDHRWLPYFTTTPFGPVYFLIFSEQSVPLNCSFLAKWRHRWVVVYEEFYWWRCSARLADRADWICLQSNQQECQSEDSKLAHRAPAIIEAPQPPQHPFFPLGLLKD